MADISKIKPNGASGEEYEIKDTTARTGVLHLNALTQSTKTVTGNPITVNDAAPINAEDITVDITPVQLGSGTPSPDNIRPIEGRTGAELDRVGKNWFGYGKNVEDKTSEYRENYSQRVTTVKNSDNSITISPTGGFWSTGVYVIEGVDGTLPWKLSYNITENTTSFNPVMAVDTTQTSERLKIYATINNNSYLSSSEKVTFSNIQLELGTTATTYEPYQGAQYTASFGETVYGGKWHVTKGGTDKTHANIANYNGETINEPWLSSMDEYSPGATPTTGAQVVYPLTTPTTISTPKQNVPMLQGINTVFADCGDTQLKYQPDNVVGELKGEIEDNIIYEDFKWTTESSQSYSAGTPGTYGTSSWRDVKKEGYDVIGVTFVENRRFGDCILTLDYISSTGHVEVIIFRATSSAVTIADEDIEYRVAYKKRT